MPRLVITDEAEVQCQEAYPGSAVADGLVGSKVLSPEDYSLRLVWAELDPGGTLCWDGEHGDEGVYLLDGELDVDGRICPTGGAVIVEAGVAVTIRARTGTRLLHLSSIGANGSHAEPGHTVHVFGPGGWLRSGDGVDITATWFADSTCPTCRIALFHVDHRLGFAGELHSHSQDEIIYVLGGSVQLGKREHGPGTCFCIAADTRYRVSYPHGGVFLNFRADVSEQRFAPTAEPMIETALARGGVVVGDFR